MTIDKVITIIALKVAGGIIGVLLLYMSLFMYEDEEGKIQNRLEDAWLRVAIFRDKAMSAHVAVVHVAAETVSNLINRLFGSALISYRAAIVSMYLSAISLLFLWAIVGITIFYVKKADLTLQAHTTGSHISIILIIVTIIFMCYRCIYSMVVLVKLESRDSGI